MDDGRSWQRRQAGTTSWFLGLAALLAALQLEAMPNRATSANASAKTARTTDSKERAMETVTITNEVFHLELAVTPEEHRVGLMFRRSIAADGGMIFVFPREEVRDFWMAYCLVDLDVIFADASGTIVAIHEMAHEPERGSGESETQYYDRLQRYNSSKPAKFAIELKAGSLSFLGLKVGDSVPLDIQRLNPQPRRIGFR